MKMLKKLTIACLFFLCCFCNFQNLLAQNALSSKEIAAAVDSIFADKNDMTAPGASVIILQNEKVLLSRNYGAANLAFGLPFDENTVFPLEGFTEQLVAFSILQLEKNGLIDLDDAVNKHLPDLGFQDQVSLAHLLNHSSGLPSINALAIMAGWNFSDPFSQDEFLDLTKKFTTNSIPGKGIEHNHAGVKILQLVVEKVSGKNFSEYASINIFGPLSMTKTKIENENYENRNVAVGYRKTGGRYLTVSPVQFELFCPKTYSTQSDFQKWMSNVQSKRFNGGIIERLDESVSIERTVQERSNRDYCFGQQQYYKYRGKDDFCMSDTSNGYSWKWIRSMQSKISIMVVGNLDSDIAAKANAVADALVDYDPPKSSEELVPLDLSKREMESFPGLYWNEDYFYTTEINIKDGNLYHADADNGFNFSMVAQTKTFFKTPFGGSIEFADVEGRQALINVLPDGSKYVSKKYSVPALKEGEQLKFEGVYASDKLNAFYRVVWHDKQLVLKRSRKPDLVLTPIGGDQFRASEVDFRLIEFKEEIDGSFQKLTISSTAVKSVEFMKL